MLTRGPQAFSGMSVIESCSASKSHRVKGKNSTRAKHPALKEITTFQRAANYLDAPKEKDMWLNKIKRQADSRTPYTWESWAENPKEVDA